MTTLKPVTQGMNQFCGPAALSILTGLSTDECEAAIKRFTHEYKVTTVSTKNLLAAGDSLGLVFTPEMTVENGSMFYCFTFLAARPGKYLLMVPRHVVVIEVDDNKQIYICDNHTKEPINAGNSARLGQKCQQVFRVTEKPKPVFCARNIIVEQTAYATYVKEVNYYENPDHDRMSNLGMIQARGAELIDILKVLNERFMK